MRSRCARISAMWRRWAVQDLLTRDLHQSCPISGLQVALLTTDERLDDRVGHPVAGINPAQLVEQPQHVLGYRPTALSKQATDACRIHLVAGGQGPVAVVQLHLAIDHAADHAENERRQAVSVLQPTSPGQPSPAEDRGRGVRRRASVRRGPLLYGAEIDAS